MVALYAWTPRRARLRAIRLAIVWCVASRERNDRLHDSIQKWIAHDSIWAAIHTEYYAFPMDFDQRSILSIDTIEACTNAFIRMMRYNNAVYIYWKKAKLQN